MTDSNALPELLPHGRHIGSAYEGGAWGQSTEAERKPAAVTGTLARFDKRRATSTPPQSFGWIKATYCDAIEYSGSKEALEGMIFMFFFVGGYVGLVGIGCGIYGAMTPWASASNVPLWFYFAAVLLGGLAVLIGAALALWSMTFTLRHVWRTPRDLPIVFDRRNRKVYRMLQDVQPGIKGLFAPWPVKAVEYEWDLIDAEHDAQVMTGSGSAMRLHRLAFVVRKSAGDPTIIDHFEIGKGLAQSEPMIAPMWEHIRRFMEEGGPHLPDPSEPLDGRSLDKPTWWQACGRVGPFGSDYFGWWEKRLAWTLYHHGVVAVAIWALTLPFQGELAFGWGLLWASMTLLGSLPMNWGQGTGIWLLAHTSRNYDWPKAVKDAIGPAVQRGQGWS